jgi:hypothetical protein
MSIAAQWASERDLIVSVLDGGDLADALLWHGYPRRDREAEWVPVLAEPTPAVATTGCES